MFEAFVNDSDSRALDHIQKFSRQTMRIREEGIISTQADRIKMHAYIVLLNKLHNYPVNIQCVSLAEAAEDVFVIHWKP